MVEAGFGYLKNHHFLKLPWCFAVLLKSQNGKLQRPRAALGLANATAMAKAWKQAYYWYRVVEAEHPELIRHSADSSYYYGLAELTIGDSQKAIPRFLTTVNLHPEQENCRTSLQSHL